MSMTQMAVARVLENPVVTAPIVGASRPEQLDDALTAVDKGLDGSLKVRLDDLTREYRWGNDIR
jgi:aryl-alcohol dehydrogenase-like predicted oxidoreductase